MKVVLGKKNFFDLFLKNFELESNKKVVSTCTCPYDVCEVVMRFPFMCSLEQ
jgi:hypothetical protein